MPTTSGTCAASGVSVSGVLDGVGTGGVETGRGLTLAVLVAVGLGSAGSVPAHAVRAPTARRTVEVRAMMRLIFMGDVPSFRWWVA